MKHTHSHFNLYSCTVQWQKGKLPRAATLNSIKLYWILCMTPFEFKNNQLNEECIGLCMYSITPKSIQATCTHFCSVHKKKSLKHKFSLQFSFTFIFFLIFLDFCTSFVLLKLQDIEAALHYLNFVFLSQYITKEVSKITRIYLYFGNGLKTQR